MIHGAVVLVLLVLAGVAGLIERRRRRPVRLHQLAGLARPPAFQVVAPSGEIECAEEVWRELTTAADMFVRAGGAVSPEWYAAQSLVERVALVDAVDRLWASRAAAIGTATQGRKQAAQVLARADGGRAALRTQLAEAALSVAREAAGQEVRA